MPHQPFRSPRWFPLFVLFLVLSVCQTTEVLAASKKEKVVEKYETGEKKAEYFVKNDERTGPYTEYHLNGELKVKARYIRGKLDGEYVEYHANGVSKFSVKYRNGLRNGPFLERDENSDPVAKGNYDRGKLDGPYLTYRRARPEKPHAFEEGVLVKFLGKKVHPRDLDTMTEAIQEIHKQKVNFKSASPELLAAWHRLQTYRYLCGVNANVKLIEKRCNLAEDEADILADQKPEHVTAAYPQHQAVKIPDEIDPPTTAAGIDAFMAHPGDSEKEPVLYRRQCLNLRMEEVGIGSVGPYAAMSKDSISRLPGTDWKVVAHPAPGYTPVDYFSADRPWSIMLNHKWYRSILEVKAFQVRPVLDNLTLGKRLEIGKRIEIRPLEEDPEVEPHYLLIFHPQGVNVAPGQRYWVQVNGFHRKDGNIDTLEYLVEFTDPIDMDRKIKKKRKSRRKPRK